MPDYPYGVKLDGNQILSYAYDSLGRMTSRTVDLGTDYQTAYGFLDNTDGTTTTLVDEVTESVDGASHVWSYTYDERGNITEIHLDSELLHRYSYDNLDQLVQEEDHVTDRLHVYTYDAGGNRTSHRICDLSDPWDPLSVDSYAYGDAGWKDKLTAYNGESITYDEIGNPLTWRDGAALSWQHGRELASFTKGGETYTYRYDEDGYRVARQHGDTITTFYLNGSSVLTQKTGDERIDFLYDDNSQLLGLKYNGTSYYYRKNLQGDITGILDPDGEQVVSYTYDAWGKPTSCTGSLAGTIGQKNPFRYRGYYYDTESGLYYTASRYYDPEAGRFLSPDALDTLTASPSSLTDKNLYAYCDNNPVMRQDSSGEFWGFIANIAKNVIVNVATTVVTSLIVNQSVSLGDIAVAAVNGIIDSFDLDNGSLICSIIDGAYTIYSSCRSGASFGAACAAGIGSFILGSRSTGLLMEEFQIEGLNCADRFFVEEVGNFSTSLMSNVVSRIAVDATKKSQNNKNIQKSKPSQSTSNNNQKTTGTPDKDVLNEIHNRFFVFQGLTGPTELDNTIYINNLRRALG